MQNQGHLGRQKKTFIARWVAALRRPLALTGAVALAVGLVVVPAAVNSAAAVHPGTQHPAAAAHTAPADPVTVTGPHLYDPATQAPFPTASSVTVSQATGLTDQDIHVTWKNFTPTGTNGNPWYENEYDDYAVMATECRGTHPSSWSDCYEDDTHGLVEVNGPDGPPNTSYAITGSDGTGQLNIMIETRLENTLLGCSQTSACSLAIVPGQGGVPPEGSNPADCSDHSEDILPGLSGTALAYNTFEDPSGTCSWNDRIVIPLHFAPLPIGCPVSLPSFSAAGSPMLAVAMQQWQAGLCRGQNALDVMYNSTPGEPTAVGEAVKGDTDVAFTTRPASADGISTGGRPFVYAPVAVSAESAAYWFDDNTTGQPLSGLKLNQRLMAKLLTTSYNPDIACTHPGEQNCDPGVDKNPFSVLKDKEFRSLNPGIVKNTQFFISQPYLVPTTVYGRSDLTWVVNSWINANRDARSFLAGQFDPWGTHVNTYYLGQKRPVDQFVPKDPNAPWTDEFLPASPLSQVVTYQALNEDEGYDTPVQQPGGGVTLSKDPPEPVGDRMLLALLDQGDAALNQFPVASIANAAGDYVQPTQAAMAAALSHMISDGDGTLQVNQASTDPAAYPLTMVIYAMVPTQGLCHATAATIAHFLDFAAGAGQTQGSQPGNLPAGYLPLTAQLKAQTLKDAREVAAQSGGTSQ